MTIQILATIYRVGSLFSRTTNFADFVDLGTIVHQELAMLRHRGLGSLHGYIDGFGTVCLVTILPFLHDD